MPTKQEYPPLLDPGFHKYALCDFCKFFVGPFEAKGSKTRGKLMSSLQIVIRDLVNAGIVGELWVGNSFVTWKIDPNDIDIILSIDGKFYENATSAQIKVMDWIRSNLKHSHGCDSYLLINFDDSHPRHGDSEWDRTQYLAIFGFYHPEGRNLFERKGVATLSLPDCMP